MKPAWLVLEDGTIFKGVHCGYIGETEGEVVFHTGMTGYQEIITDPSYRGQIVTLTYPLIGNYGHISLDYESRKPQAQGIIVHHMCHAPSHWRSESRIGEYLQENKVVAITGIDTRALTKKIRNHGTMRGIITSANLSEAELQVRVGNVAPLSGRDLVSEVTASSIYTAGNGSHRVVLLDCGAKENIIRALVKRNCRVTVVPASTSAEKILRLESDGILLSNGPGDPQDIPYVVNTVQQLLGKRPLFGICLGHQILGLACGATTYKLKYGHHGGNHPVKDLRNGRVHITSQNHGFAIDEASLEHSDLEVTHINLTDQTVEGMQHRHLPAFSVQYHPEGAPGPEDSYYLFDRFIAAMHRYKEEKHA